MIIDFVRFADVFQFDLADCPAVTALKGHSKHAALHSLLHLLLDADVKVAALQAVQLRVAQAASLERSSWLLEPVLAASGSSGCTQYVPTAQGLTKACCRAWCSGRRTQGRARLCSKLAKSAQMTC